MNNPLQFYNAQISLFQSKIAALKKKLLVLSLSRVVIYLAGVMGVYIYFHNIPVAVSIAIVAIGLFLYFVSKHTDAKAQRNLFRALLKINNEELEIAKGNFYKRFSGNQFQNSEHPYSLDIDLFGRGSFFQYLDRTAINEGTHALAEVLKSNDITNIPNRQEAIKELSKKPEWRQLFTAKASLIETETPTNVIIDWLNNYQPFVPKIMRWLPYVFGTLSTVIIVCSVLQIIPLHYMAYWLIFGIFIIGFVFKKVNMLSMHTSKIKDTFRQYALLLHQIETETFTSTLLKNKQLQITSENDKASDILKSFSKALDALDNRNNIFFILFGNGFFLWDLIQSYKIEQWITTYAHKVEDWFEVVAFFDAYNSLSNFSFNHAEFVYPKITANNTIINTKELGHPLLDKTKRIASDLNINKEQFFIVTGANMAGKSTFLRTVSLHIVMANVGLPVCAASSEYTPIKLITSMRTSDSLTDNSSYFFSELTRLKFIVDTIKTEPYFIVLDEILKGTNSTDKAQGSRKFVEKLVAGNATGIIATHDLSLCEIEKELDDVKNYYFDADIVNDELYFDYKLKKGICQNMNASFLLKKMEIV
ncbi:MutS-related protein [Pontimicrobium aquaticum]|uniref:DNA mismatch repair protein MutS n=1 Tax=Pontimicrobium aquaticum TaxID=2565367 RepID=A0A4U0F5C3_9FLAO|nr:DNA mismatch repair protein MutS [Pontimicrobium aquaticum]TJY38032.1 DNA mismatch repair protein MutS [Pontimicrobium aquaticum]